MAIGLPCRKMVILIRRFYMENMNWSTNLTAKACYSSSKVYFLFLPYKRLQALIKNNWLIMLLEDLDQDRNKHKR